MEPLVGFASGGDLFKPFDLGRFDPQPSLFVFFDEDMNVSYS